MYTRVVNRLFPRRARSEQRLAAATISMRATRICARCDTRLWMERSYWLRAVIGRRGRRRKGRAEPTFFGSHCFKKYPHPYMHMVALRGA